MTNANVTDQEQIKQQKKEGKRTLSLERNRIAFERLQLAWARSCLTLIVIAIGIYEFYNERMEEGKRQLINTISGRDFALFLVAIAVILLVAALFQHRKNMTALKRLHKEMKYSVAALFSYFVLSLGFSLFVMALIKG